MKEILTESGGGRRIKAMNFLFYCFCLRSRSRLAYLEKLDRADAQLEKEMDLGRFLKR